MRSKTLALTLAALVGMGSAVAGPVTVTTGAGYIKMVDALTALYQKETGQTIQKSFGGNIGQMLAQVKHGDGVNVVISDEATLKRFNDLLSPEASPLGQTPLVLIWRKGVDIQKPADIAKADVKSVASPNPKVKRSVTRYSRWRCWNRLLLFWTRRIPDWMWMLCVLWPTVSTNSLNFPLAMACTETREVL